MMLVQYAIKRKRLQELMKVFGDPWAKAQAAWRVVAVQERKAWPPDGTYGLANASLFPMEIPA
jgi:hypothetical protein